MNAARRWRERFAPGQVDLSRFESDEQEDEDGEQEARP